MESLPLSTFFVICKLSNMIRPTFVSDQKVLVKPIQNRHPLSAWFNALPPYVAGVPLWEFGANNVSNNVFTQRRSIYLCPMASAIPTISPPDPDSVTGIQPGVGPGPTFNYGMNQRINFNLPPPANVPETPFKITQAANPSAFVVFSEQRVHASETPYYPNKTARLEQHLQLVQPIFRPPQRHRKHCLW
jgi:hypothetical protein